MCPSRERPQTVRIIFFFSALIVQSEGCIYKHESVLDFMPLSLKHTSLSSRILKSDLFISLLKLK